MKTTKKILISLFSLPLLLSAASAFATSDKANQHNWVAISDTKAKVLANDIKKSKGLVTKCYPGENKIVVDVKDLTAHRGAVIRYWTDNNQGTFITRSNGIVSSAGNDAEIVNKFISDIAHDYTITFQAGQKTASYTLVGSANTIRSLEGCGLPKPRGR